MIFASLLAKPRIEIISTEDAFGVCRVRDIVVYDYEQKTLFLENNQSLSLGQLDMLNGMTDRQETYTTIAEAGQSTAKGLAFRLRLAIARDAFDDLESAGYKNPLYSIRTEDALRFLSKRYYFPVSD